jgi:probable F420-dependent oxidoreductase
MQYGVVFPQYEFPNDPLAIKDFAQTAENLGFGHILAYSHVLGANPDRPGGWKGPYTYHHAFQEPTILFSYMAGVTEKMAFVTGIIILPQRQTALFAKQAATLDILCGGRLRLGVALGWNPVEYTALDRNFHNRGKRFEEQVQLLRLLWTKPLVTFKGQWHHIPDAGLNPLPQQRPIPLWFGGHADPVLHRVARMGDGWLPNYRTAEDAAEALNTLNQYLAAENRTLEDIGIEPRLRFGEGDPQTWQTICEGWQNSGATHMTFNTLGAGFKKAREHFGAMETFAESMGLKKD